MLDLPAILLEREGASAPFLFQGWTFFAVEGVKLSSVALVAPVRQHYLQVIDVEDAITVQVTFLPVKVLDVRQHHEHVVHPYHEVSADISSAVGITNHAWSRNWKHVMHSFYLPFGKVCPARINVIIHVVVWRIIVQTRGTYGVFAAPVDLSGRCVAHIVARFFAVTEVLTTILYISKHMMQAQIMPYLMYQSFISVPWVR